eukprot:14448158-Alexandrium_andersonii.AAC.1
MRPLASRARLTNPHHLHCRLPGQLGVRHCWQVHDDLPISSRGGAARSTTGALTNAGADAR